MSDDQVLSYFKAEMATLRTGIAELGGDVKSIASELRAFRDEQGPRVAVLEHRVAALEAEKVRQGSQMFALKLSVAGSFLAAILSLATRFITGG
ncbi:hypothetical protein [Saccharopolyspora shandongensis]|uniref:hypothetical protein n=1 Tax=Saccharopolyspora shandongensis TaxID=418495 RepID=UPI0033C008E0